MKEQCEPNHWCAEVPDGVLQILQTRCGKWEVVGEVSLTPGPDCEIFVKLHLEFIIYHVHHRELLDII